jgi:surfeit locus 1 family protein
MGWLTRRTVVLIVASIVAAALFARLGVWQLDRLHQRRTRNRLVAGHIADPPIGLAQLPRDSSMLYRRVHVTGTYDFAREIVLIDRVRDGAPGVQLITPARIDSGLGDTLVLINRGWVYSPDGMSLDETAWREAPGLDGVGYVQQLSAGRGVPEVSAAHPNRVRWLDAQMIARLVGHPVTPYQIVLLPDADSGTGATKAGAQMVGRRTPSRIAPPPLDEGPHLSYAIQWFSFATIALAGAGVAAALDRRRAVHSKLDAVFPP